MKGFLNINKPKDWTSFDVVAYLRKVLKVRKIGHLGTLDPMATGVLPITIGSATKLFDKFQQKQKTYIAEFEFGYITDSLDATGKVLGNTNNIPSLDEISAVLPNFIGNIEQIPPQFSAKKVNGQKAYDIARNGGTVELKPKLIEIKDIKIISFNNNILKLEITCGSGTYIRSLCRDIAEKLNSLATMISLQRTKVGIFDLNNAINIKDESIEQKIIPIDFVFSDLTKIEDENIVKRLLNGQKLDFNMPDGEYSLYSNGIFVGLAKCENSIIKMIIYFN